MPDKPVIFPLPRSNLALDDAQQLFFNIMRFASKELSPAQVKGLANIYNAFKPKLAKDAAPQLPNRKDQDMPQERSIQAAMKYLKSILSDEQLAELTEIMGSTPINPDDPNGDDQPMTMAALGELTTAREETTPVLGGSANDASLAYDSAPTLYRKALDQMGVSYGGSRDVNVLRAIYRTARSNPKYRQPGGRPVVAMDSARETALSERFPHAAKIKFSGRGPDEL